MKVDRLAALLHEQIQETSRLGDILKKEREAYEEAIKQANYPASSNRAGELKLISDLRRSLEEGIVQNNKLRAQMQEKISKDPVNKQSVNSSDEVHKLYAKLEESERWNMSLQSRLDALQPRVRGVGGSHGNLTVLEATASRTQPESVETTDKVSVV